ncbi:MAG: hypothetical protein ABI454_02535 [Sphingomicrobium sp.]
MTRPTLPQADLWLRRLGFLLVGFALLVIAAAYGAMTWEHGTALLWNVVVHEDGHRTFAQTLFYFEHATRELPIDLLLGVTIGAAAAEALPGPRATTGRLQPMLAGLLVALVLVITVPTGLQLGLGALWDNLLQYHTREGAPLVWGAHWRYHLLERGPLMLLALGFWGIVRALRPEGSGERGIAAGWIALGGFIALTALFTPDLHALSLPFTDPRYLGHEIREIFTHSLVTMPLGIGVLLLYPREKGEFLAQPGSGLVGSIFLVGVAIALLAYVLLAAIGADAASEGQSDSMITLLAPHFFEHGFTYLVTSITAVVVFEKVGSRRLRNVRNVSLPSSALNA